MKEYFDHAFMRRTAAHLLSYNMESQVFAIDATAQDIQTTGTKAAILNGTPIQALTVDAAYDISAELPYAAWSAAASYTTGGILSECVELGRHFVCIAAHTSAAANRPLSGASWRDYWQELGRWAVAGVGVSVAQDMIGYYLCCALADGTLRIFKAFGGTATATTEIKIPVYDPTRYIPIGMLKVAPVSGAHVLGTTALTTIGTFSQLIGPVFPHSDFIETQQT